MQVRPAAIGRASAAEVRKSVGTLRVALPGGLPGAVHGQGRDDLDLVQVDDADRTGVQVRHEGTVTGRIGADVDREALHLDFTDRRPRIRSERVEDSVERSEITVVGERVPPLAGQDQSMSRSSIAVGTALTGRYV